MTVDAIERLKELASAQPNAELIESGQTVLSYAGFLERTLEKAKKLQDHGVRAGQSVLILTHDSAATFGWVFGTWLAGGIAVPVNPSLPSKTLEYIRAKTKPAAVVQGEEVESHRVGDLSLSGAKTALRDPGLIMFTSGTTGVPKGACLALDAVSMNAAFVAETLGVRPSDRLMINTPPYFISGLIHFLTQLWGGGGLVCRQGFHFGVSLLQELGDARCTGFGGAPAHFSRIFETASPEQIPSSLRFLVSSGDHLPTHLIRRVTEIAPHLALVVMYGLTEVSGRLCVLPPEDLARKVGSAGRPLPGMKITVRSEDQSETPVGQVGELYVEGPMVMSGYLGEKEERDRSCLTPYGFRTGDFGTLDQDGFVWLRGRKDGVFKCGAEKVSTLLIQEKLLETGLFSDATVVRAEDMVLGSIPRAIVVPKHGFSFDQAATLKALRGLLPASHLPRSWSVLDRIPRTGSGKVSFSELPG